MLRTQDWGRLLRQVRQQSREDRLSLVAAGVAFYGLLSMLPALAALLALYGLFGDTSELGNRLATLRVLLPPQALDVVVGQLRQLMQLQRGALGWGAAGAMALMVWSAMRGVRTLLDALDIAYGVQARRPFVMRHALVLLFTLAALAGAAVVLGLVVFLPALLRFGDLAFWPESLARHLRWPLLAVAMVGALAVAYRYGPTQRRTAWPSVAWGGVVGTALWLVGSAAFSLFVSTWGHFDRTYGALAAFVILLIWLLVSAYAVLLGAEFSAALECSRETEDATGAARRSPGPPGRAARAP